MHTLLKLPHMYIKGPSNVLECDVQCCTFQGGGEHNWAKPSCFTGSLYLTMVVYGSLDKVKLSSHVHIWEKLLFCTFTTLPLGQQYHKP
jgi:hypothetical protein